MKTLKKMKYQREKTEVEIRRMEFYLDQIETIRRMMASLSRVAKKVMPFDDNTKRQVQTLEVIDRDWCSLMADVQEAVRNKQYELEELDGKIREEEGRQDGAKAIA